MMVVVLLLRTSRQAARALAGGACSCHRQKANRDFWAVWLMIRLDVCRSNSDSEMDLLGWVVSGDGEKFGKQQGLLLVPRCIAFSAGCGAGQASANSNQ